MMESTPLLSSNSISRLLKRQRALKEKGVGKAAHLIKDAVFGHQDAPYEAYYDPYANDQSVLRNNISVICGRLVVQLKGVVVLSSWILFMLTFFEPPHWCRDADSLQSVVSEGERVATDNSKYYGDCKLLFDAYGTTADNEDNQPYYPNSSTMLLTISESMIIELACVLFISLYMTFAFADDGFKMRFFFYQGYKCWTHTIQCISIVGLIASIIFDITILNHFLRMLLLGTFLRGFQRELWTFLKMFPQMLLPLWMLSIIVVFYAWFAVVMFYDTPQGKSAFPNLAEAMWTLWICVTTANYPDVSMLSYNEHRGVSIFFISFMVLSFFYVMNLVLAVAVNAYDSSIDERKRSRKELSQNLLNEAFVFLDHNNNETVSRSSIMNVMTILNEDIAEIQELSEDAKAIMFAVLDKDGNNQICRDEFLHFGSVLLLNLEKKSSYATFVETHLPSIFRSTLYQTLCNSVKSQQFEHTIDIVLLLNAIVVGAQDYPQLAGHEIQSDPHYLDGYLDTVWEVAETVFTALYVIEALLKIMTMGWRTYIQSPRNAFDFFITILVCLASAYVFYPNAYNNRTLIEFVVMARVLRLGRLLFSIKQFRLFGYISLEIIPPAASVFMVLLFIGYFFSSLGMLLFGGVITRDPRNPTSLLLLEADDFVESNYWANNFNDMLSGMIVLFNWLVVNNWTTQTTGLEHATGDKWLVRLFFFSFYVLGVIGISNVITSFIINAFFQQLATVEHMQGPEETIEGEATIGGGRGLRAVFDPSTITGTKTGLTGSVYFARIKAANMDVELDEREALRKLFSRSS